jgi:hypothetical protein
LIIIIRNLLFGNAFGVVEICGYMNKELTVQQKKEWAEMLYLTGQHSQKEIAAKVGCKESQITLWKEKGLWEKKRKSLLTTKSELLRFFYDVLDKLKNKINATDGIGTNKDADSAIKWTAAIKNLETESSIADLMEAGKQFHKYLQLTDPDFALKVLNNYDAFIKEKLKSF